MDKNKKSELCQDVSMSIEANKDIIADYERNVKAMADTRSTLYMRPINSLQASINWNIRDMRRKIEQIREL